MANSSASKSEYAKVDRARLELLVQAPSPICPKPQTETWGKEITTAAAAVWEQEAKGVYVGTIMPSCPQLDPSSTTVLDPRSSVLRAIMFFNCDT
jgi:hypothetical protein